MLTITHADNLLGRRKQNVSGAFFSLIVDAVCYLVELQCDSTAHEAQRAVLS